MRPLAFASRTFTSAEARYAQIEKQLLMAVWCCEKFDKCLMGLNSFVIQTNQKPLLPTINNKDVDTAPIYCQRLSLWLMRYNVTASFIPEKLLVVADVLFRKPIHGETSTTEVEVEAYVNTVSQSQPASDQHLEKIRWATEDDTLQLVAKYTWTGWPHVRHELSVADGMLYVMRPDVLSKIYHGHQGVTKCRERDKQGVWWPRLSQEIADMVAASTHCITYYSSQNHEPLIPSVLPDRPGQHIGTDYLQYENKDHMVISDYYSQCVEIVHMPSTTARATVEKFKNICPRWGIPERVTSDNGPQFSAPVEFQRFAELFGIELILSSPGFPQSNRQAESGVQLAKCILRNPDPSLALMTYRMTSISATGLSPSKIMIGRRIGWHYRCFHGNYSWRLQTSKL